MNTGKAILIVGGSGLIGQKIAHDLALDYPGQVIIAARDLERASQVAAKIGGGVQARRIDVTDRASVDAALEGISIVISCVAQHGTPQLLLASVAHGCGYTDIAPIWAHKHPPSEALKAEAVNTGACVIWGAGMVPGISSILARMGADCVGPVEVVESTCLLSAGDEFGLNSREYLGEEFVTPFKTTIDNQKVRVWPFTRPRRVEFAPPIGRIAAYLIPFTDQVFYPQTLGARTAVSRLAFLPQWPLPVLSVLLPVARKIFAQRRAGMGGSLNGILAGLKRRYKNLDWWGVHVEVRGSRGIYRASLLGHQQATGTALSAASFVRALIEREVEQAGIWAAEQIVPVDPFLARLAAHGLVPTIKVESPSSRRMLDHKPATGAEHVIQL